MVCFLRQFATELKGESAAQNSHSIRRKNPISTHIAAPTMARTMVCRILTMMLPLLGGDTTPLNTGALHEATRSSLANNRGNAGSLSALLQLILHESDDPARSVQCQRLAGCGRYSPDDHPR